MGINVANILKVADAIEQASVPGLGFNMGVIYRDDSGLPNLGGGTACGTIACIAGWTLTVAGVAPSNPDERSGVVADMHVAAKHLGLTFDSDCGFSGKAADLFMPVRYLDNIHTSEHAVRCLRNLAITGKVDWEAAMKPNEPELPPVPVRTSVKSQA